MAGNQVVVDLETQTGDLGVYFPADGQLSEEMCFHNNLYTESAYRELFDSAPLKAGFFSIRRRVRTQNFRGQKSDGYWVNLAALVDRLRPDRVEGRRPVHRAEWPRDLQQVLLAGDDASDQRGRAQGEEEGT